MRSINCQGGRQFNSRLNAALVGVMIMRVWVMHGTDLFLVAIDPGEAATRLHFPGISA
jgi:hypothetical protein